MNFIGFVFIITLDCFTISGKFFFVSFDHSPPLYQILITTSLAWNTNLKMIKMKTQLIFLALLMSVFSCGTNKSVSDAEKDKIKGEVKEVVNTIFKNAEDVNFDLAAETLLDSPDFVYISNGKTFSYNEFVDGIKPVINSLKNQKATIVDEKYAVLDNSTVLYTANSKWLMNFKDGHSILQDPWIVQFIFKKIDSKWKVISSSESGAEQNVLNSESSKGLNQAELLMKFVGNREIITGKDSAQFVSIKSLQGKKGLSIYSKWTAKGEMLFEGTGFWAFDASINKIDISIILSTGDVIHDNGVFTSPNTMEYVNINNAAAYTGISKSKLEFVSSDEIKGTTLKDNKEEIEIWKRIKL